MGTRGSRSPSTDGSGRFDPVGSGQGACYLAEVPLGAWMEVFHKKMLLAEPEVLQRSLLSAESGWDARLADLTSRRALAFEATASMGPNDESQAFAAGAVRTGFDGVRYLLRHAPAQQLYGIALFGQAAERTWPVTDDGPIPDGLVADARRRCGYRILPAP